jgi:hypothetical protein
VEEFDPDTNGGSWVAAGALAGRGFWYIPNLVLIGLIEGAFGGLVFVGLQRWLNPKDSRVARIRNSVLAWILVAVGGLWMMTAIYR